MIAAVHQPQYLPWPGYFDKIDRADVFVFLDTVQFKKNEWQNRNRVKTARGWQWLTVPVHHHFGQKISETLINNRSPWRRKHISALNTHYQKAPFFDSVMAAIEPLLQAEGKELSSLNTTLTTALLDQLGLREKPLVAASSLKACDDPTGRLVDLCRALGADTYLSGPCGREYMDLEAFRRAGIRVEFQEYRLPEYPQLYGPFVPDLSIVDLLFNCGPDSLEILRRGRE